MDDYVFRTLFAQRRVELIAEAKEERLARAVSTEQQSLTDRILARLRRDPRIILPDTH
ncbi:MAG TPA: hypothetical protein GXZ30_06655 [Propionibacterium sp.]|jgi:hypothetical protein|nr:hypothetical protein [Propionibacterium sp.]